MQLTFLTLALTALALLTLSGSISEEDNRFVQPPPPKPPLPPSRLLTGQEWSDVTLGIAITFLSVFVVGIGLIGMPIFYFALRAVYPAFTRGIGFGLLGVLVVILGIAALLLLGIAGSGGA